MKIRVRRRRRHMACCNVLVVGGKGVGKTSLVNTFLSGTFKKVKHNNVEIIFTSCNDTKYYRISVWATVIKNTKEKFIR